MSAKAIIEVENTQAATEALTKILGPEDVVLIKGSRGMRMDAIAPALEAVS